MVWRPGKRAQDRALESPYEGVPGHLAQPLWNWIEGCFRDDYGTTQYHRFEQLAVHLRIQLSPRPGEARQRLLDLCNAGDKTFALDLVEAMLELYSDGSFWEVARAEQLEALLQAGNSAYAVNDTNTGLELRIVPEVKDQVQAVVDLATGSPGDHLRNAWNEAYGRTADPVKAYSESIKAVESAMASTISPANLKATLGTMIKDVEAKPSKWTFDIADGRATGVGTVLAMMQMLWDGQTSRHGGVSPTRAETVEEARTAVHLAATLVQFAVGGSFKLA